LSAARDRRKSRKTLIINRINVVEAAGVELFTAVENTEVIDY
jgi:hypothetical protein